MQNVYEKLRRIFSNQIEYAGTVILSRTDTEKATQEKVEAAVELIRSLNRQRQLSPRLFPAVRQEDPGYHGKQYFSGKRTDGRGDLSGMRPVIITIMTMKNATTTITTTIMRNVTTIITIMTMRNVTTTTIITIMRNVTTTIITIMRNAAMTTIIMITTAIIMQMRYLQAGQGDCKGLF